MYYNILKLLTCMMKLHFAKHNNKKSSYGIYCGVYILIYSKLVLLLIEWPYGTVDITKALFRSELVDFVGRKYVSLY